MRSCFCAELWNVCKTRIVDLGRLIAIAMGFLQICENLVDLVDHGKRIAFVNGRDNQGNGLFVGDDIVSTGLFVAWGSY